MADTVTHEGSLVSPNAEGFRAASQRVVHYLLSHWGWECWAVGRVEQRDDLWIVLAAAQRPGDTYALQADSVLPWSRTMSGAHTTSRGAGVARHLPASTTDTVAPDTPPSGVRSHATVPIRTEDGQIAATLCGYDRQPHPEQTAPLLATLTTFAELLALVLLGEERADAAARRAERKELEALTDPLTQLPNRRAWDRFLHNEERRCASDGHPVAVVVADLDDLKPINDDQGHAAGDAMLQRAAEAIRSITRDGDLAARIGGDEFGVVAVHCDGVTSRQLAQRVHAGLSNAGIAASVGAALRMPDTGLNGAWLEADRAMYDQKRRRRR